MSELKEALLRLTATDNEPYAKVCKVTDVKDKFCDLEPVDGSAPFVDVPLQAHTEGGGFINYPKKNSLVLLVFTTKHNGVIVSCSDLTKLSFKSEKSEFEIDDDGFLIQKDGENLLDIMSALITAIKSMIFTTNTGPTIKLINEPQFTTIDERIKKLLK